MGDDAMRCVYPLCSENGVLGIADNGDKETQELARLIYDAFEKQGDIGSNFVQFGDSFHETFFDGDFDLYKVAEAILAKVRRP